MKSQNLYIITIHIFKKKKLSPELVSDFYLCWKDQYDALDFNFNSFVHKDYNLNNLIFLPKRNNFKKCGIIDFQNAFWGENCWDLFSLLEDSRIYFDHQYSNYFIKYYYESSNQDYAIEEFKEKYFFLNCSRQTRLLGRWIKLTNNLQCKRYLDFIKITNKRLIKSLQMPYMKKIKFFYNKIIPDLYDL